MLNISAKCFAFLIRAYPLQHRLAFGQEMRQTFNDLSRETYNNHGLPGLAGLWVRTFFDVIKTAMVDHYLRSAHVIKEIFIRLSGWGMIVAALSILLSFLSDTQIQGVMDVFLETPTTATEIEHFQSIFYSVRGLPFFFAVLLTTLGLIGLRIRYGEHLSQPARIALMIGTLAGSAAWGCSLGIVMRIGNLRTTMNSLMAIMFVGLFVFGLVAVKEKPMARGNSLPILAGFWWPFIVLGANLYYHIAGQWLNVPYALSITLFSAMSFFLALLGFVLQADASDSIGPAAVTGRTNAH